MGALRALQTYNARASAWFDRHPGAYYASLVLAPAIAVVALESITGGHLGDAAVQGLVFGLTFATVTWVVRRFRTRRA